MFQNISTLIFDLDGTISDPSLGIEAVPELLAHSRRLP